MNEERTWKRLEEVEEEFEDTKWVIRIHISKNRQHNGQMKKHNIKNNDLQNKRSNNTNPTKSR